MSSSEVVAVAPLLAAIRREVEASEERLVKRIVRLESHGEQYINTSERLARLEEKLTELEGQQPKHERRFAELTGQTRGVMEELNTLVKQASGAESRARELQRKSEESWRSRFDDLTKDLKALELPLEEHSDFLQQLKERSIRMEAVLTELHEACERTARRLDLQEAQLESFGDQAHGLPLVDGKEPRIPGSLGPSPVISEILGRVEKEALKAAESAEKASTLAEHLAYEVKRGQAREENLEKQLIAISTKIDTQALETAMLKDKFGRGALQGSGFSRDVSTTGGLEDEVRTLKEAIIRAEAAVKSLAPRLLAEAAGSPGVQARLAQAEAVLQGAPATPNPVPTEPAAKSVGGKSPRTGWFG